MLRWLILSVAVVAIAMAGTVVVNYLPASTRTSPGELIPVRPKPEGPAPKMTIETDDSFRYGPTSAAAVADDQPVDAKKSAEAAKREAKGTVDTGKGQSILRFGTMSQQLTGEKVWVVKNEGLGDLILRKGSSTCSCTIANFKQGQESMVLKPGDKTEIKLTWETRGNNGPYHKGASIFSNDPDQQALSLQVEGIVRPAVVTYPQDGVVDMATISNEVPEHKVRVALYSPDRPEMRVTQITSSRPEYISATTEPLTEEDRKQLNAPGGYRATIVVKSGMPLGAFKEEVVFKLDHPEAPEHRIVLMGKVAGPILATPERLRLHHIRSSEGGRGEVVLSVQGHRPTQFEVVKAPAQIKAEVAPRDKPGEYLLIVTVPPGTESGSISDKVVLKTNHPQATEVKVPVDIFVLNSR